MTERLGTLGIGSHSSTRNGRQIGLSDAYSPEPQVSRRLEASVSTEAPFREFPAADSLQAAQERIKSLGLPLRLIHHQAGGLSIPRATLELPGSPTVHGAGKGIGDQADASCMFELLEHYASERYWDLCKEHLHSVSDHPATVAPDFAHDLVSVFRAAELGATETSCYGYQVLGDPHKRVSVYPELVDPYWGKQVYSKRCNWLAKYFSNSGFAAGMSFRECLYHGVCEIIERDAVSRFLISTFVDCEVRLRLVDPDSVHTSIRALWTHVQSTLDTEVFIFDVTSAPFSIPSYLAVSQHRDFAIGYSGAGASVCPSNALERALLELLQDWTLRRSSLNSSRAICDGIVQKLAQHKRLVAACTLDVGAIFARASTCSLVQSSNDESFTDLATALDQLLSRIALANIPIYFQQVGAETDPPYVYSFIIPGAETFSIVRSGHRVAARSRLGAPL